jgi:predicted transcriptional regulator
MATTIQISDDLLKRLQIMKLSSKESYEDIIWDIIEDRMELSEQTKKNIAEAEADIRAGRIHKWEDIVKELKINVRNNRF